MREHQLYFDGVVLYQFYLVMEQGKPMRREIVDVTEEVKDLLGVEDTDWLR